MTEPRDKAVTQRAEDPDARKEGDDSVDPPSYPTTDDSTADDRPPPTTIGWGARIGLAVVVVVVVIVVLHLTGVVGPATN